MRTFVYPAQFELGEKPGVLVITFGDIPEAITQGKGEKDALPLAAPMAAKAALYLAMGEAQTNNAALARKPGCDEKEARRMLDPRHPTKLPRVEEALAAPGRRLVTSVEEAA